MKKNVTFRLTENEIAALESIVKHHYGAYCQVYNKTDAISYMIHNEFFGITGSSIEEYYGEDEIEKTYNIDEI